MRTLSRTQSGAGGDCERRGDAVLGDDAAVLEHERRAERAEVVEQDAVGAVARRDRAHPRQAVAERRMQRRQQQCVLGRDALGDRDAAHLVDVALAQQQVGLAVVGAERAALGPELAHERQQVAQVARVRRLAQQHPGAPAALLQRLGQRGRLVVGRDARGEVGVQLRPVDARRVPVDALAAVPARSSRARPARPRSRPGSSSSRPGRARGRAPGSRPCRRARAAPAATRTDSPGTHDGSHRRARRSAAPRRRRGASARRRRRAHWRARADRTRSSSSRARPATAPARRPSAWTTRRACARR